MAMPMGTHHPKARPIFRWRPERVKGIPVWREILLFMPEMPTARFHEKEKPYFLPMVSASRRHRAGYILGHPAPRPTSKTAD